MIETVLADVGWVLLTLGALALLAGAILSVTGLIGWLARGWDRDER